MLFKRPFLDRIRRGRITLAFRRWQRATVRGGGTLTTPIGVVAIESVTRISAMQITAQDAERAGYATRSDLLRDLRRAGTGSLFRIELRYLGADPRIALRAKADLAAEEISTIRERLTRFDTHSPSGPWTERVLDVIGRRPEVRAAALAAEVSQETLAFKANVQKLKNLGLTESLDTGYRLSPRGRVVLKLLRR